MSKSYRVIMINKETKERQMMPTRYSSYKKAVEWATEFSKAINKINNNVADFEIKQI